MLFIGSFAICIDNICKWPEDNTGNILPTPPSVTCDPMEEEPCDHVIQGGICTNSSDYSTRTVCDCVTGYQKLYGHCVPTIYCKCG